MRIIQISDTHISRRHDFFAGNVAAIAAWLAAHPADLVVHTGDLAMDGAGDAGDLDAGAAWLAGLDTDVACVPGNHDVGDLTTIKPSQTVDDARLDLWRSHVGADRWSLDRSGWRLIGLNAMLFGSGHAEEERQFAWLEATLAAAGGSPVAVFLHKPLFVTHPDEPARGYWTVAPAPRARLLALLDAAPVRLIASGHLHIDRHASFGAAAHVWGPAASFVCGESQEDLGGVRRLGLVEHVFHADHVESRFIRPPGLDDLTIEPVQHILYPRTPVDA